MVLTVNERFCAIFSRHVRWLEAHAERHMRTSVEALEHDPRLDCDSTLGGRGTVPDAVGQQVPE
jgi:hypothetical protein